MEFSAIIVWQNTTAVDVGINSFNVYPFMPDSISMQYCLKRKTWKSILEMNGLMRSFNFIYLALSYSKSFLNGKFYTYRICHMPHIMHMEQFMKFHFCQEAADLFNPKLNLNNWWMHTYQHQEFMLQIILKVKVPHLFRSVFF